MSQYYKPFSLTLLMLTSGYLLLLLVDMNNITSSLYDFKALCQSNKILGYTVYSAALCIILFSGLPFATALMLLAGIIYSFWEAATIITACRVGVAVSAFSLSKGIMNKKEDSGNKPRLVEKMESHPYITLLLMRLAPLPDSVINYSASAVPVKTRDYAIVSFIGMIPATLMVILAGKQLGSLGNLISSIS